MTMTGLTAYDSTQINLIPSTAQVVVCYRDGRFANEAAAKARFPNAHIVPLTVRGGAAPGIDFETGDAEPDIVTWLTTVAEPPYVVYSDLSDMNGRLLPRIDRAGLPRSHYKLFPAHPNGIRHICGPNTCGQLPVDADATQYLWSPGGVNIDVSEFRDDFFGPPPKPAKQPAGHLNFQGSLDASSGRWTVHGMPSTDAVFGDVERWASVELQVCVGGKRRGQWRHHSLPWNAPPLGS